MNKLQQQINSNEKIIHLDFESHLQKQYENLIMVSHNKVIRADEIVKLEASGAYTKYHLKSGKIFMSSYNLKRQEKLISNPLFFRIHKSFIINMCYVSSITFKSPMVVTFQNSESIQVSRRKAKSFWFQIRYLISQEFIFTGLEIYCPLSNAYVL